MPVYYIIIDNIYYIPLIKSAFIHVKIYLKLAKITGTYNICNIQVIKI